MNGPIYLLNKMISVHFVKLWRLPDNKTTTRFGFLLLNSYIIYSLNLLEGHYNIWFKI